MFNALKVRLSQGSQYIPDLRDVTLVGFRGRPVIGEPPCEAGCQACRDVCPTAAIAGPEPRLDLGRCVFCNECVLACPDQKLHFGPDYRMASGTLDGLVVGPGKAEASPVAVSEALHRRFGRSLKLRSVSAGGCNGCELELNAVGNVNFDLGRYGIEFVASPRHADALVLSGPLTRNMNQALETGYAGIPEPKFIIAVGACAISGGLYADAPSVDRSFATRFTPSLYVPGCPPHPLTFVNGIMDLLGIRPPRGGA
ncbi:MAG: NADH:ubiquinone oxidoreductase [Deltaproteobacteria bacterium]|nr:NADH:ubiquinone oxidoreductase [Deltaproteobacteria bacterium]